MLTVTDPAQAKALTDVNLIGFVQSFIGHSRSVSEAAHLWKLRVDAAYYRVRQLERLGLIAISSETGRAGRNLKRYRAVADNFFVPLGIVPEATLEAFLEATNRHFQALLLGSQAKAIRTHFSDINSERWGIHIGLNAHGQQTVHLSDQSGSSPDLNDVEIPMIADAWPMLRLNYADAQAIRRELFELFQRYDKKQGSRKYLFHFALAPLED